LEVARLLASIRRRIVRLVVRHGIDLEQPSNEPDAADERLFDCPVYARIVLVLVSVVVPTSASAIQEEQEEVANGHEIGRGLGSVQARTCTGVEGL